MKATLTQFAPHRGCSLVVPARAGSSPPRLARGRDVMPGHTDFPNHLRVGSIFDAAAQRGAEEGVVLRRRRRGPTPGRRRQPGMLSSPRPLSTPVGGPRFYRLPGRGRSDVTVSEELRIGTELLGYRVEELVGQRRDQVVYLAEQLRLKRRSR